MAPATTNSNFEFINDDALRENLDRAFDHILELISLSESPEYDKALRSSFRKTIIIYTASIIEALLLHILKQSKTEEECAFVKMEFEIVQNIYQIDEQKRIVLGEDKGVRERLRFDKLNLDQIMKLCREHSLINTDFFSEIDRVRALRNRQHLGGLSEIDRDYTKKDLEFVFSVAREVKIIARKACKN